MATVPMVVYLWMTQILMISRCPARKLQVNIQKATFQAHVKSMIHGWVQFKVLYYYMFSCVVPKNKNKKHLCLV